MLLLLMLMLQQWLIPQRIAAVRDVYVIVRQEARVSIRAACAAAAACDEREGCEDGVQLGLRWGMRREGGG